MNPEIEHEPLYVFKETPREAYEKMVAHFSKPGAHLGQSPTDRTSCAYRTSEGYSCAVGCLIPDGEYDPLFDNPDNGEWDVGSTDIDDLVRHGMLAVEHVSMLEFMRQAQKLHDQSNTPEEFVNDLEMFWQEEYEEASE